MNWMRELLDKYKSSIAHCFLLWGNVFDYVDTSHKLIPYLIGLFAKRPVIVIYDRSQGLSFPNSEVRKRFIELVGLEQASDAALAAQYLNGGSAGDMSLPREPAAALALVEKALRQNEVDVAVIIQYAETLAPAADFATMSVEDRTNLITFLRWASEAQFIANGHPIILITQSASDIHPALRAASSKVESIEIPLPNLEERKTFIEEIGMPLAEPLTSLEAAALTAGCMRLHIEDIHLRRKADEPVTRELILQRRDEITRSEYGEVLEIPETVETLDDHGGAEDIKKYVLQGIAGPMKRGDYGVVPMGVLLVGPAGTGKTAFVKRLAGSAGVNFVILRMERILGQYVGNSERNLAKAIACIKALAPVFVFIDEIEQVFQRQTDSGNSVAGNLFSMLLQFASDTSHRGRIVLFAATNRPDLMDAALKRPGRFDKKIPFLPPEQEEREAILKVLLRKCRTEGDLGLGDLAIRLDGYTGAEIEAIVTKAKEVAARTDGVIRRETLVYALEVMRPSTSDIEFMTQLALREVNDKELLPRRFQSQLDNRQELEKKVEESLEMRRRRREL